MRNYDLEKMNVQVKQNSAKQKLLSISHGLLICVVVRFVLETPIGLCVWQEIHLIVVGFWLDL
jgi:hypothetical protein